MELEQQVIWHGTVQEMQKTVRKAISGRICGLTLSDIDLGNRIINIDHQLQRSSKMEYIIESTKTNAGIRKLPKITPHVCRHTHCSNMAKAGINPKTLQYLMGHSDIGVTLNTYTHLGLEDAEDELKRVKGLKDARKGTLFRQGVFHLGKGSIENVVVWAGDFCYNVWENPIVKLCTRLPKNALVSAKRGVVLHPLV